MTGVGRPHSRERTDGDAVVSRQSKDKESENMQALPGLGRQLQRLHPPRGHNRNSKQEQRHAPDQLSPR